jgi:hypothetical protein
LQLWGLVSCGNTRIADDHFEKYYHKRMQLIV